MRRSASLFASFVLASVMSLRSGFGIGMAQEETPAGELPIGVGITPLVGAVLEELPAAPARLQVSQLILQPGAELPPSTLPGVSAILVQAGSFTARCGDDAQGCQLTRANQGAAATPGPDAAAGSGEEMALAVGDGLVVPAGVPSGGRNDAADQVVLLIIAILPQESGGVATPVS